LNVFVGTLVKNPSARRAFLHFSESLSVIPIAHEWSPLGLESAYAELQDYPEGSEIRVEGELRSAPEPYLLAFSAGPHGPGRGPR
jgi:hypothetical protein